MAKSGAALTPRESDPALRFAPCGLRCRLHHRGRHTMPGTTIKVRSTSGGAFDCYLALPAGDGKRPAIVLAAAVHGVDKDIRDLCDEFAAHGFIAAAPDLFWQSVPGPLPDDDERTR